MSIYKLRNLLRKKEFFPQVLSCEMIREGLKGEFGLILNNRLFEKRDNTSKEFLIDGLVCLYFLYLPKILI